MLVVIRRRIAFHGGTPGRVLRCALVAVAAAVVAGACAAPARDEYTFTAPGGQSTILYDPPPTRGRAPVLSGDSVTAPGLQVGTGDYPGLVLVINIWGSWCGPCRAETPRLEGVFSRTRELGVQFLGIDVRDSRDAAADFLRDRAVSYPSIFDPPGRSLIALRGYPRNVVPSTIVLDRGHRVAAAFLTPVLESDLEPVVRRLAAEPAPARATGTPARGAAPTPAAPLAPAAPPPLVAPGVRGEGP